MGVQEWAAYQDRTTRKKRDSLEATQPIEVRDRWMDVKESRLTDTGVERMRRIFGRSRG